MPTYTGRVTFTSTDPQAVLPANYTFTAGDAGTQKFTGGVTLKTAGAMSVRVTDTAHSSITGAAAVTVTPSTVKSFRVSIAAPDPYPEGSTQSVTVTALDAYGNVATGFTGAVHFTSTDGTATLPADYTFQAGDNGSHEFNLGIRLLAFGPQTVTVTYVGHSSTTGYQTVIVQL